MPAFFFTTDEYLHGIVMANYTSGAPVHGNLTLKATVRPVRPVRPPELVKNRERNPYDPNYPYANAEQEYDSYGSYNRPVVEKYFNFVSVDVGFEMILK